MTLQQEAYRKIDQLSDEGLKVIIDTIDSFKLKSVLVSKEPAHLNSEQEVEKMLNDSEQPEMFPIRPVAIFPEEDVETKKIRAEKKKIFLDSAGKIDIDDEAIKELRKRSMV